VLKADVGLLGEFFVDDFIAQVNALIADVHARAGNQLFDLLLRLAAEGTLHQFCGVSELCHALKTRRSTDRTSAIH
jgi:hypothetical protein